MPTNDSNKTYIRTKTKINFKIGLKRPKSKIICEKINQLIEKYSKIGFFCRRICDRSMFNTTKSDR